MKKLTFSLRDVNEFEAYATTLLTIICNIGFGPDYFGTNTQRSAIWRLDNNKKASFQLR
jgi:hypothetical protein